MIKKPEPPQPVKSEEEDQAILNAQAQVTAEEEVPEAFDDQFSQPEEVEVAGLGSVAGKIAAKVTGKKARQALSQKTMKPGIAGNAAVDEAEEILTRQAQDELVKQTDLPPNIQSQIGRQIDPARTPQRNISLKYIDNFDDIGNLIDDVANVKGVMDEPNMQVETWAQTGKKAQSVELDLKDIFDNSRSLQLPKNASEQVALKQVMLQSAAELKSMGDDLLLIDPNTGTMDFRADATPEKLFEYRKAVNAYTAIYHKYTGQAREAARLLNAQKMPAGAAQIPMKDLMTSTQPENLLTIAKLIHEANDPAAITAAARESWSRRAGGMLYEYWINNLLGSIGTHTKNFVGNGITMSMAIPEHYLASGIGTLRKGIGGTADSIQANEVNAMSYGLIQGVNDGISAFFDTLKKDMGEVNLIDPTHSKLEYYRKPEFTSGNMGLNQNNMLGKTVDFIGKWYVRLPGRFLQAEDELFKAVGYRMKLNEVAYRTANAEGLSPSSPAFYARVSEVIKEPPLDVHAEAINFARYQTFTNDMTGNMAAGAKKFQETPIGKYFIPFLRTPVNILKYGMSRTPVGFMMPSVLRDLKAGGKAADLAMSRMTMGSTIAGSVALSLNNYDDQGTYRPRITGAGPMNPGVAAQWRQYGIEPYSIFVDGKYYPYDVVEPFGTVLAVIANGMEVLTNTDDPNDRAELIETMSLTVAEYTTDKSYMQGFSNLLDLIQGRSQGNIKSILATFSPTSTTAMSKVAKDVDPIMRETKDVPSNHFGQYAAQIVAQIKSRTPGMSDGLMPKTDVFGQDIYWGEPLFAMHSISPAMARPMRKDEYAPYVRELVVHKIGEGKPTPVIRYDTEYGPVTLNLLEMEVDGKTGDELFYEYRQMVGEQRFDVLSATVLSDTYTNFPDLSEERGQLLSMAMNTGKSNAKELFRQKHSGIIDAGFDTAEAKGTPTKIIPAGVPETEAR